MNKREMLAKPKANPRSEVYNVMSSTFLSRVFNIRMYTNIWFYVDVRNLLLFCMTRSFLLVQDLGEFLFKKDIIISNSRDIVEPVFINDICHQIRKACLKSRINDTVLNIIKCAFDMIMIISTIK